MAKNNRLVMMVRLLIIIITITASVADSAVAQSYDPMCTESSSSSSSGGGSATSTTNGVYYYYNRACSTEYFPPNATELQGYILDSLRSGFYNNMLNTAGQPRSFCDRGRKYGSDGDRPIMDYKVVKIFGYASCGEGYDPQQCVDCLDGASQVIRNHCDGSAGVRAWSEICCARYEQDYDFC
ncbi:unnamed protein product [Linum trigynum]|uniref:Gnk2-homologous domain-containing protein n=1 Tax=Linum trigynum TaxID=586398 RepID=A0AAV2E206_9ROSI